MRICILGNAQAVHTQRWATAFAQRGHTVDLLSIRSADIPGVTTHPIRVGPLNSPSIWWTLLSYMRLTVAARRTIKRLAPDVVHAHYSVTHGVICASARVRPVVLTVWGSDVILSAGGFRRPFLRRLNRFALRHAAVVTSTSDFMMAHVRRLAGGSINVVRIPFGVDTDRFTAGEERVDGAPFTIGYVKHLNAKYGPGDLIRAFAIVSGKIPDSRLVMAGAGKLRSELEDMVDLLGLGDRVDLLGRVDHRQVPQLMRGFDVLVNPTVVAESFGVVILEAAATGLPTVVTRVGGVSETAIEGETALFVEPGQPDMLAAALVRLARSPGERHRLGAAGRRRVEQHFAWSENVDAMLQVLHGASERAAS